MAQHHHRLPTIRCVMSSLPRRKMIHFWLTIVCCCYATTVRLCGAFLLPNHANNVPVLDNPRDCSRSTTGTPRTTTTTTTTTSTRLHGIKGFRIWFENQFPESIVEINADSSEETFDHVLMDMNHIIHVILRRSRSEEHAVRLLMSELDAVLKMAVPTQSLVLAIDGAPAAAKLATQRSRRYGTLVRTEWKLEHFDKLRISKSKRARKLRSYNAEIQSLKITPGTEFQDLIESTLLYWAWQRLQHRHGKLKDVRIYISPSTVAGEGEVKILEWILQKPRQGQSVAILGRDSDLLLEGLIIPPYWTHNIFVIQADLARKYDSVSLWETTRKLQTWLPAGAPPEQILQLRTDLVLLMMLNGNDYLPKLKGSKGFSNLCQIYRRLLRDEFEKRMKDSSTSAKGGGGGHKTHKRNGDEEQTEVVGLVDADTLDFRLDFCIQFFQEIVRTSPLTSTNNSTWTDTTADRKQSPLSKLNNLVDGGFVPQPKRFRVIKRRPTTDQLINSGDDQIEESMGLLEDDDDTEDGSEEQEDEDDTEDEQHADAEGSPYEILVQLTLGDPETEDFLRYELWHEGGEPLKSTKHKLSLMALDDFFGTDLSASSDEDYEELMESTGITSRGYSWEIPQAAPGKVDTYLGGLLWNIQTYQDGICADYNYSYGRRTSPTPKDIVEFLQTAQSENLPVSRQSLLGNKFSPPVSAGLSCLAALPSQVKHLIPEPYNWISDETVEELYAQSMDKEDNAFDMKLFEALCEKEIQRIRQERGEVSDQPEEQLDDDSGRGRRILSGDHWWTVVARTPEPLTHPFNPPTPPCKDFSELFPNPRVRVSRVFAVDSPRPRAAWGEISKTNNAGGDRHRHGNEDIEHSTFRNMLRKNKANFLDIPYKVDYPMERQRRAQKKKKREPPPPEHAPLPLPLPPTEDVVNDVNVRMEEFHKAMPPADPVVNVEGHTALYILSQLHDLQFVGPIQFNITVPSTSDYAATNPKQYEHYHLNIAPSKTKTTNVLNRTIVFDQDRDVNRQSRQSLKQHLADLALSEMLGPDLSWQSLSLADLRWALQNSSRNLNGAGKINEESRKASNNDTSHEGKESRSKKQNVPTKTKPVVSNSVPDELPMANAGGQSALECLQQLEDIGLIGGINYLYSEATNKPQAYEHVTLVVAPSNTKTPAFLDREVSVAQDRLDFSRKEAKQRLASLALAALTGPDLDWSTVSSSALKTFLMGKTSSPAKKKRKRS